MIIGLSARRAAIESLSLSLPPSSLRDTDNRGVKPSIRRIPSVSSFRAKRSIQARSVRLSVHRAVRPLCAKRRGRCDRTLSRPTHRAVPPSSTKTPRHEISIRLERRRRRKKEISNIGHGRSILFLFRASSPSWTRSCLIFFSLLLFFNTILSRIFFLFLQILRTLRSLVNGKDI